MQVRLSQKDWFEYDLEVARWLPCQHCKSSECTNLKVLVRDGQILMGQDQNPRTICHAQAPNLLPRLPKDVRAYPLEDLNWDFYKVMEGMYEYLESVEAQISN